MGSLMKSNPCDCQFHIKQYDDISSTLKAKLKTPKIHTHSPLIPFAGYPGPATCSSLSRIGSLLLCIGGNFQVSTCNDFLLPTGQPNSPLLNGVYLHMYSNNLSQLSSIFCRFVLFFSRVGGVWNICYAR